VPVEPRARWPAGRPAAWERVDPARVQTVAELATRAEPHGRDERAGRRVLERIVLDHSTVATSRRGGHASGQPRPELVEVCRTSPQSFARVGV